MTDKDERDMMVRLHRLLRTFGTRRRTRYMARIMAPRNTASARALLQIVHKTGGAAPGLEQVARAMMRGWHCRGNVEWSVVAAEAQRLGLGVADVARACQYAREPADWRVGLVRTTADLVQELRCVRDENRFLADLAPGAPDLVGTDGEVTIAATNNPTMRVTITLAQSSEHTTALAVDPGKRYSGGVWDRPGLAQQEMRRVWTLCKVSK